MLTEFETDVLDCICKLNVLFQALCKAGAKEAGTDYYDGDMNEITGHIHDLQNWILANEAARNDHKYRLMGAYPWPREESVLE